jgi:hypothetical protein
LILLAHSTDAGVSGQSIKMGKKAERAYGKCFSIEVETSRINKDSLDEDNEIHAIRDIYFSRFIST